MVKLGDKAYFRYLLRITFRRYRSRYGATKCAEQIDWDENICPQLIIFTS